MITITLEKVKDELICFDSWEEVKAAVFDKYGMDKPFPLSLILDSNGFNIALLCARCLPEHNSVWREFACFCALQNVDLIKPYFSDDDYDLIISYLNNPTDTADAAIIASAEAVVDTTYDSARAAADTADAAIIASAEMKAASSSADADWAAAAAVLAAVRSDSAAPRTAADSAAIASFSSAAASIYSNSDDDIAASRAADNANSTAASTQKNKLRELI